MNLPVEKFGDVVVVHAPEELGREHIEQVISYLTSLDRHKVVLDMDNTESIDSGGLELLLHTQRELRDMDGDIKIATNNTTNQKILEITRLSERLEVYDGVIDAVKSFA